MASLYHARLHPYKQVSDIGYAGRHDTESLDKHDDKDVAPGLEC